MRDATYVYVYVYAYVYVYVYVYVYAHMRATPPMAKSSILTCGLLTVEDVSGGEGTPESEATIVCASLRRPCSSRGRPSL